MIALSGKDLLSGSQVVRANFFAGNTESRGGIRVALHDLDGDNRLDLITGAGDASGSTITTYLAKNTPSDGTPPVQTNLEAFPGLTSGVFVG